MIRNFIAILFFFFSLITAAQDVKLTASVDKTEVPVNSYFQYTLTLTNARADVNLPALENFKILRGPSFRRNTTIVGNKRIDTFSYTYFLQPTSAGSFEIPPARVNINGQIYESNSVRIKALAEGDVPQPDSNSDFFIVASFNKKSVYLGESIEVAIKLYSKYDQFRARNIEYPQLVGFWAEEIVNEKWQWEEGEIVNGRHFNTLTLKQYVMFPQQTGELKFGQVSMDAVVSTGLFGRGKVLAIRSKPVSITVKPLPGGKPEGFLGTYGKLNVSSKISRTTVNANESLELTVTFSGSGNLKLLDEPKLIFPESFEIFDPRVTEDIAISPSGISGKKIFTYVLIPREKGSFIIPETKLSYFDTRKQEYISYPVGDYELEILPGKAGAGGAYTYDSQSDVNVLSQDIRFIKTDTQLRKKSTRFFGSITYFGLFALPLILLAVLIGWKRNRDREQQDEEGSKRRKAGRVAKKQFIKARKLISAEDDKRFFSEVSKAIYGYFGNKFSVALAEMSKTRIRQELTEILKPEEIDNLIAVIEKAEMAQYAPGKIENKELLIAEAENWIKKVEEIKK